jgi:hypothetical protein
LFAGSNLPPIIKLSVKLQMLNTFDKPPMGDSSPGETDIVVNDSYSSHSLNENEKPLEDIV